MTNVYEFAPFGRPITRVRHNTAGDLCFASAKTNVVYAWRTDILETFGSYSEHTGAVNDIDISNDSKCLLTAGSDYLSFLFDVETGKKLWHTEADGNITTCGISKDRKSFYLTHNGAASKAKYLTIYHDINSPKEYKRLVLANNDTATTCSLWSPFDDCIILCQKDGTIQFYDLKLDKVIQNIRAHNQEVNDFTISPDGLFGVSSSRDTTAKLWNMKDMVLLHVFKTPRPVNTADFSPTKPHIAVAGGVHFTEITTTDISEHLTQHRFFNYITGVEFANIAGHSAGLINSLRYNPNGDSLVSGAENGTIRFHQLDEKVFSADKI